MVRDQENKPGLPGAVLGHVKGKCAHQKAMAEVNRFLVNGAVRWRGAQIQKGAGGLYFEILGCCRTRNRRQHEGDGEQQEI
jgi:hypothetical protein